MRYTEPSAQCRNIYRFIRLVLGDEISDREIARRWGMDEKNLRELKKGLRVVPKLSRLEHLAEVLGVHRYYILEVASGVPAEKIHEIARLRLLEDDLHMIESVFEGRLAQRQEKERLLAGLRAAVFLACRCLEPAEMFRKVALELKKYDFESHVFFLDQETGKASIQHSSFSPRLLHAAESVTGLSLKNFCFPVEKVPLFKSVVEAQTPLFLPDASVLLQQILGEHKLRRFVKKMKSTFRILEVALAPITIQGEVKVVFATGQGGRLSEDCLPEFTFFTEQLSHCLENAFLHQEVKASANRLQGLFENLPEGVFECDEKGRIVQMNPAGAAILGFKGPEEAIGRSVEPFRLLNPEARTIRKESKKSKRTRTRSIMGVAVREDGVQFLTDVTTRTHYDRRGSVARSHGVFRDLGRSMQ